MDFKFVYKVANDPDEPRWSNTNHGNRHQRIFSLEKVVMPTGHIAHWLCVGKHQLSWIRISQIL